MKILLYYYIIILLYYYMIILLYYYIIILSYYYIIILLYYYIIILLYYDIIILLYYYPVRCAHNPPPCHFLAFFSAQQSCFQHFLEDVVSRSVENKSAKSKQFAVGFSRFWEVRSTISGHFGGPGAHVEDFWDCCDFGDAPAAKN